MALIICKEIKTIKVGDDILKHRIEYVYGCENLIRHIRILKLA